MLTHGSIDVSKTQPKVHLKQYTRSHWTLRHSFANFTFNFNVKCDLWMTFKIFQGPENRAKAPSWNRWSKSSFVFCSFFLTIRPEWISSNQQTMSEKIFSNGTQHNELLLWLLIPHMLSTQIILSCIHFWHFQSAFVRIFFELILFEHNPRHPARWDESDN